MDFGCGDGSFSSLIFQSIDYGVDSNPEALKRAQKYHVYRELLSDASSLATGSLQSVFSSSVLEHVKRLESVLFEISRVLAPGGTLIFSVPVTDLKKYFIRYFGRNFEAKMNQLYRHYNLLDIAQWKDLLERNGLRVLEVRYYQPDWATFLSIFFLLLNRKACKVFFKDTGKAINRLRPFLIKIIKDSISIRQSGSTVLIMAQKI
jgi:SAM-dependent methyltransferase